MKNINFYSNGSCKNHGCEAIYVSLMKILGDANYIIYTENEEDDKKYIDDKAQLVNIFKEKNSFLSTVLYKCKYKILKTDRIYYDYLYKPFYKNLTSTNEVFLSVGGDNYCYGFNEWLYSLNRYIKKNNNKLFLVGCSLEDEHFNEEMIKNLTLFQGIIARETLTYSILKKYNLPNVYLVPDPAFLLPTEHICTENDEFYSKDVIGLNFSPLIINKGKNKELLDNNINNLILYILEHTNANILFIPHVFIDGNSDYKLLQRYYEKYQYSKRVRLIKEENASRLKGYISKCKVMVAARTHASIAAYSNFVPTLVIGYSIKSKGIAKDLFGSYDKYVIPLESFKKEDDLIHSFNYIYENRDSIKKHLNNIMGDYSSKCYFIRDILEEKVNE